MVDPSNPPPKLGDILTELQLIDDDQVVAALAHQTKTGKLFGESLLDLGFIAEDDLCWALSSQLGLPFVAASPEMTSRELLERFSPEFLRKHHVLPLVATESSLSVVVADPTDKTTVARLERMAGAELNLAVGTPSAIRRVIQHHLGPPENPAQLRVEPAVPRPASMSSPELATLMDRALTQGAASVHLDPEGERVRVRFRDAYGEIAEGGWFPPESLRELVRALDSWLGSGRVPAPGIRVWDQGPHTDPLPFIATCIEGASGPSLTLALTDTAPRHQLAVAFAEDESILAPLLERTTGLILAVAPTWHERDQLISRILTYWKAGSRRGIGLVSREVPLPTGVLRFPEVPGMETVESLCRQSGIDLLTGSFEDPRCLPLLAGTAGRDRLVVAAFPGNGALGFLARMLEGGVPATMLAESLLLILAQKTLPAAGEIGPRAVTETLTVDRPLRRALQNGGHIDALRAAAREQDFQEIAVRARTLDAVDEASLTDLDRHRYLEDAA